MKNYEVGIIIGAIVLIGYLWWKNSESTPIQQPIGNVSMVSFLGGPLKVPPCCVTAGGALKQPTTMISASCTLVEQP